MASIFQQAVACCHQWILLNEWKSQFNRLVHNAGLYLIPSSSNPSSHPELYTLGSTCFKFPLLINVPNSHANPVHHLILLWNTCELFSVQEKTLFSYISSSESMRITSFPNRKCRIYQRIPKTYSIHRYKRKRASPNKYSKMNIWSPIGTVHMELEVPAPTISLVVCNYLAEKRSAWSTHFWPRLIRGCARLQYRITLPRCYYIVDTSISRYMCWTNKLAVSISC